MHCPIYRCASTDLRLMDSHDFDRRNSAQKPVPAKFQGANMVRRRYMCRRCNHRWFTVEITETLYDEFTALTELEQSVRKAGTQA